MYAAKLHFTSCYRCGDILPASVSQGDVATRVMGTPVEMQDGRHPGISEAKSEELVEEKTIQYEQYTGNSVEGVCGVTIMAQQTQQQTQHTDNNTNPHICIDTGQDARSRISRSSSGINQLLSSPDDDFIDAVENVEDLKGSCDMLNNTQNVTSYIQEICENGDRKIAIGDISTLAEQCRDVDGKKGKTCMTASTATSWDSGNLISETTKSSGDIIDRLTSEGQREGADDVKTAEHVSPGKEVEEDLMTSSVLYSLREGHDKRKSIDSVYVAASDGMTSSVLYALREDSENRTLDDTCIQGIMEGYASRKEIKSIYFDASEDGGDLMTSSVLYSMREHYDKRTDSQISVNKIVENKTKVRTDRKSQSSEQEEDVIPVREEQYINEQGEGVMTASVLLSLHEDSDGKTYDEESRSDLMTASALLSARELNESKAINVDDENQMTVSSLFTLRELGEGNVSKDENKSDRGCVNCSVIEASVADVLDTADNDKHNIAGREESGREDVAAGCCLRTIPDNSIKETADGRENQGQNVGFSDGICDKNILSCENKTVWYDDDQVNACTLESTTIWYDDEVKSDASESKTVWYDNDNMKCGASEAGEDKEAIDGTGCQGDTEDGGSYQIQQTQVNEYTAQTHNEYVVKLGQIQQSGSVDDGGGNDAEDESHPDDKEVEKTDCHGDKDATAAVQECGSDTHDVTNKVTDNAIDTITIGSCHVTDSSSSPVTMATAGPICNPAATITDGERQIDVPEGNSQSQSSGLHTTVTQPQLLQPSDSSTIKLTHLSQSSDDSHDYNSNTKGDAHRPDSEGSNPDLSFVIRRRKDSFDTFSSEDSDSTSQTSDDLRKVVLRSPSSRTSTLRRPRGMRCAALADSSSDDYLRQSEDSDDDDDAG